ncbi:hypothetical protein CR51_12185 [Caballeronia megalochromosomata]|nr:hypothetical protein CR51_12185 [Caballeronia megalochromosomata]
MRVAAAQQFEREIRLPKRVEHFGFAISVAPWGKIAVQYASQFRFRTHGSTRRTDHAAYIVPVYLSFIDGRGDDLASLWKRAFPCAGSPTKLSTDLLLDCETVIEGRRQHFGGETLDERVFLARCHKDTRRPFAPTDDSLCDLCCDCHRHTASLTLAPTL